LMAELGHGLFGAPGIEGHRQGLDGSPVFATTGVLQEGQRLTLTSEDQQAGLRLESDIELDSSGVLRVRHGLTNLRPQPWQVDRLAVTLPVAERARDVMAFHGRWIREFQPHRLTLEHDSFVLENRRGRTSHEHFPALITGSRRFAKCRGGLGRASGLERQPPPARGGENRRSPLPAGGSLVSAGRNGADGRGNVVDAQPLCQLFRSGAERHEPAVPPLSA
jgi:hypothetical protein